MADTQRFQVEAAYLTLTSNVVVAAITEASLRGADRRHRSDHHDQFQDARHVAQQLDGGYINRSDVAAQQAALAQAKATLPPLRKALAQERDLLAALAGGFPTEPRSIFRLATCICRPICR